MPGSACNSAPDNNSSIKRGLQAFIVAANIKPDAEEIKQQQQHQQITIVEEEKKENESNSDWMSDDEYQNNEEGIVGDYEDSFVFDGTGIN